MNLYLYHCLFKVHFNKATSKTWTRTLKNMEYVGLKNMSDFKELCFNKIYVSTHKM